MEFHRWLGGVHWFATLATTAMMGQSVVAGAASSSAERDDLAALLAHVRLALGTDRFEKLSGGLVVEGEGTHYGARSRFKCRFDSNGRYVRRIDGDVGETLGFDGQSAWIVDASGLPRVLENEDREWPLLSSAVWSGTWAFASSPFELELLPSDDPATAILQIHRRGSRVKGVLVVDRSTWLPKSLERRGDTTPDIWTFSAYEEKFGLRVPTGLAVSQRGTEWSKYQVTSVSVAQDDGQQSFAVPTTRPRDATFDAGVSARLTMKRAKTGHVLVRASVDRQDPGWFILDTGASSSVIDRATAAKLNWKPIGEMPILSIFGPDKSKLYRAATIKLGPLTIERPFMAEMDLSAFGDPLGEPIRGVLGFEIFSRSVAEIVLADGEISLHNPDSYSLKGGAWRALHLPRRHPATTASFEGPHEGLFRLDLGAAGGPAGNVTFHTPTVDAFNLLNDREILRARAGKQNIGVGEIAWFELGGHRFEHVQALFALDHDGPLADDNTMGNIGVAFLEPFRVVLDYAHMRIAFAERAGAVK
jgi:hypothetical protein